MRIDSSRMGMKLNQAQYPLLCTLASTAKHPILAVSRKHSVNE